MSHLAFVTTELAPYTSGGAGVLVSSIADGLRSLGHRVTIVLCATSGIPAPDAGVVIPEPASAPGWDFAFMDLSMAAAEALSAVHASDPIAAVEFQDFDGLGFWTLTHRRDLGLGDVPISVRVHGPVDLQIEAMGETTHEFDVIAAMERETFLMADRVVVPSTGLAGLVSDRYGLEDTRVAVGPPVVRSLADGIRWNADGRTLVVAGRLSEVKGSHDMVNAAIPVLRDHNDVDVVFVGGDGWSISSDQPMSAYVSSLVPDDLKDRIHIAGPLEPYELAASMASSLAVVVPSRFETFNLAAHEARHLGVPVIVPDIAAFSGPEFDDAGFLRFDGSVPGLTHALTELVENPSLPHSLGSSAPPQLGDPLDIYGQPAAVRHERSQGGVATAALARVEAVRFSQAADERPSLLKRVAQRTPSRLVDVVKPLVPRGVKSRIKTSVGWDGIADARSWADRWSAIESASAAGGWRLEGEPAVSVIVPCFNQGAFVRQAIVSVFEQTFPSFEVIVVDDGSDDPETVKIIESIDLDRVSVIHQANTGLPGARNAGIRQARGQFIVPLDADDLLDPRYLEVLVRALEDHDDAAYAHCWAELFGDFHSMWATRPPNRFQLLLSNSVVGCVVLRKSAWESVGGYDEGMRAGNEDWDLWIRLSYAGHHGIQVREPLFRYRKHGVSMSVETEGSYEAALAELPSRLPHIYNRRYVADVKAESYPLLSVLSPCDESDYAHAAGEDFESITVHDSELASAVAVARGKYMVLWPKGTSAGESALVDLCRVLEDEPDRGAAATFGSAPIVVVRSWSLRDRAAPQSTLATQIVGSSPHRIEPGMFGDDDWTVPSEISGIPVQRQRPEEAGFIPDWVPA